MGTCEVCGFNLTPGYGGGPFCSEFCAETSKATKEEFLHLKVGDYGLFPCSGCGIILEDTFSPHARCSRCASRQSMDLLTNRVARMEALLKTLRGIVPATYRQEIDRLVSQ